MLFFETRYKVLLNGSLTGFAGDNDKAAVGVALQNVAPGLQGCIADFARVVEAHHGDVLIIAPRSGVLVVAIDWRNVCSVASHTAE